MNFQTYLIWARKQKGLTAAELSRRISVSRAYLSDVEHGKEKPSASFMRKCFEIIGFPDFLTESTTQLMG